MGFDSTAKIGSDLFDSEKVIYLIYYHMIPQIISLIQMIRYNTKEYDTSQNYLIQSCINMIQFRAITM